MGLMKDFDIRIRNGGDDAAGAVNELMAELQRRLLELQDSMPRWIPVSERMPQLGQQVLAAIPPRAWNEENQAIIETLDYEQKGFYSWKDDEWTKGVTHWMPLPAPPTDAK